MGGTTRKAIPLAAIRSLAEPEVFERGRASRRQGAVSDLVIRGDDLPAIRLRVLDARGHAEGCLTLARAVGAEASTAAMLVRLGRIDTWTARIEGLIETHRSKYELCPLPEAPRYDA